MSTAFSHPQDATQRPETRVRHLTGIRDLPKAAVDAILARAASYAAGTKPHSPARSGGLSLVNLFLENSTRTRVSFEIAGQRLGMGVVNMGVEGSSILKGESLADTIETLLAMGPRALVIRHGETGSADLAARLADESGCIVINAGDGIGEHPTQALLDALTIREAKNRIDGLKIVICGDIRHSRVARSNAWLLPRMGAEVVLCGPREFLPEKGTGGWDMPGAAFTQDFDAALRGADVVMMLRIQKERLGSGMEMSPEAYQACYRLDHARLARLAPDALAMHPGPVNRETEITGALASDARKSLILRQVANGVFVRMAVLAEMAVAGS